MSRQAAGEQLGANDLVEGVVTADVLAQRDQSPLEIEQRRSVQTSRRRLRSRHSPCPCASGGSPNLGVNRFPVWRMAACL